MEGVANRASASKGSLYRRWSSRAELVADAVHHANPDPLQMSDTGNVRDDVLSFLEAFARVLNGASGEAVRGLMAETLRDRELLAVIRTRFIEPAHVQLMRRCAAASYAETCAPPRSPRWWPASRPPCCGSTSPCTTPRSRSRRW